MTKINENKVGQAWLKYMYYVISGGSVIADDKEPIIEHDAAFIILNCDDSHDAIIDKYGDNEAIKKYSEKMYAMEIMPEFGSAYGSRLFSYGENINQIEKAKRLLRSKPERKSVSMVLLKPDEDMTDKMPRVPCLTELMLRLRDQKLVMTAIFRSQNAYKSYANFMSLRKMHMEIASDLQVGMGKLEIFARVPHIYKSDVEKAQDILAEYGYETADVLQQFEQFELRDAA